ncbi:hypothetical protein [Brevibacillus choshinensis]|uniref:hypothetical protein n=1 Tax=Brevibacillus choshinensis TaxID=54911 RepID=UPI0009F9D3BC|nr:hypothetical protein [Brevibacillus choshinensis]MED4586811.1 hypothetical protein [Brevibacillus choshinensis]MED4755622.1 hypothetical protein [Brevibacillus choshinensis]MED4784962.1 hypothetical protein [Brevibacillus choshinensis]
MPLLWLVAICILTGCSTNPAEDRSFIQSDRHYYYQQSVVHPQGMEPNVTPYGPPVNASTSGEYDRWIRPDAVSRYPGLVPE